MQNAVTSPDTPASISGRWPTPPVALTIAGSDNSAGAGIQADLKTFTALGVYGLTALTCVVAEVPGKVSDIQAVTPEIVAEQVRLSLAAFPVAVIKTGMLHSVEIIEAVLAVLESMGQGIPLVIDPVMVATSGARLLREEAVTAYREKLLPRAILVTPNLDEASVLLGQPIHTLAAMEEAGRRLSGEYGTAFLMKGGHLPGGSAIDLLIRNDRVERFESPFFREVHTHGTGCTYSAAITAGLATGLSLGEAVALGKKFITAAIGQSFAWQNPSGGQVMALNHFLPSATSAV